MIELKIVLTVICLFLCRNIEDILAAKGESVKRVSEEEGTLEITAEDVIGSKQMQQLSSPDTKGGGEGE